MTKRLSSISVSCHRTESLVQTVRELDKRLEALKDSLQQTVPLDSPVDPSNLPPGLCLDQVLYIRFAYYSTVFDIHTPLTYPWSQVIFYSKQQPNLHTQVTRSVQIVAETSRATILATKYIHIDPNTSVV